MRLFALAALAAVTIAAPVAAQDAHAGHAGHAGHANHAGHAAAPAAAAAARFNLDTPLETIVADPAGKAALEASLPGVTSHESYEMFKTMGLRQLASYAPDRLTPEVLAKVETALAAVK